MTGKIKQGSTMKLIWFSLITTLFLMVGCGPKNYQTESGIQLSEDYSIIYSFVQDSHDLYPYAVEVSAEAYAKGWIDDEGKEKILVALEDYKETHNRVNEFLKAWYTAVESGVDIEDTFKERLWELVFQLASDANVISDLTYKLSDGEIIIPSTLIPNLVTLINMGVN